MTSQTRQEKLWTENRSLLMTLVPGTVAELVNKSGLARRTVQKHLHALHEDGVLYISGYIGSQNNGAGQLQRYYSVGIGPDVERPELSDRSLRRLRKTPVRKYVAPRDPLAMMYARN